MPRDVKRGRAISHARGHLRVSRFARRTTEKRETARSLMLVVFSYNRRLPLSGRPYFAKPLVQSVSTLLGWGAAAGLLPQYSSPCCQRIPRTS